MAKNKLNVLIVDDVTVYRYILRTVVEKIEGVRTTGFASNGQMALDKLKRVPVDVVLLDIDMPVMDGLAALRHIGERYPKIAVIMVSGVSRTNANIVVECLNSGALDFISKPIEEDVDQARAALLDGLRPIFEELCTKRNREPSSRRPASAAAPKPEKPERKTSITRLRPPPELVLIGASTGGPKALNKVLAGLRGPPSIPILIVQHMPPLFTASLAI